MKARTIAIMAGGLCLGALMCILAGAVYNAWICLVSLVMYLLAPIPLLVCKSSSEDSNDVFHDMSGGGGYVYHCNKRKRVCFCCIRCRSVFSQALLTGCLNDDAVVLVTLANFLLQRLGRLDWVFHSFCIM
eukprot:TRINITY_DN411_c0_g1_i3.p1 TRINITY_DN411_c0_g1~~TRINITY_DN411_c0_g1_i3.p1  ORF type:complete len:131 (-),score=14.58 TRINITY_DN411_c0_g1_i3:382-774(-)